MSRHQHYSHGRVEGELMGDHANGYTHGNTGDTLVTPVLDF